MFAFCLIRTIVSSAKKAENKAFTANPMAISVFVRRSTKAITCAAAFIHDTIHVYVRIVCVCVVSCRPCSVRTPCKRLSWTMARRLRRADPYEWGLHSRSRFSQHDHAACVSPSDFIRVSSVQTMAQLYKGPTHRRDSAIGLHNL